MLISVLTLFLLRSSAFFFLSSSSGISGLSYFSACSYSTPPLWFQNGVSDPLRAGFKHWASLHYHRHLSDNCMQCTKLPESISQHCTSINCLWHLCENCMQYNLSFVSSTSGSLFKFRKSWFSISIVVSYFTENLGCIWSIIFSFVVDLYLRWLCGVVDLDSQSWNCHAALISISE